MTPSNDYSGPVRLKGKPGARVQWGKRDKATALAVLDNVQQVTPPLVIPWQPHQEKIERCLRHNRAHAYTLNDIFNLVDRIARPHRQFTAERNGPSFDDLSAGGFDLGATYADIAADFKHVYQRAWAIDEGAPPA